MTPKQAEDFFLALFKYLDEAGVDDEILAHVQEVADDTVEMLRALREAEEAEEADALALDNSARNKEAM